jgi:hypothetical protein
MSPQTDLQLHRDPMADPAMSFFRTMKGAPQTVLAVLAYHGRPMTNRVPHEGAAENPGSAAGNLGSTAENLGSTAENLGSTAENLGSTAENLGSTSENLGFPSRRGGLEEVKQERKDLQPPASKPGDPKIPEAMEALLEAGIHDPALSGAPFRRAPRRTPV